MVSRKSRAQISCAVLRAALFSRGSPEDRTELFEKHGGLSSDLALDPSGWLDCGRWEQAAEAIERISDGDTELFLETGRHFSDLDMIGALEFFPWFLSSPQLVIRHIGFFTSRLDTMLTPVVDYVTENSCRLEFHSKASDKPP